MSITEIRLQLLDYIMHISDEQLLKMQELLNGEPFITQEQVNELERRSAERKRGKGKGYTLEEFKANVDKHLA